MLDLVAKDGVADVVHHLLVGELGRVDADDHQVGVLLLQPLEIGDDVHAVDAAVGPEVQEDDASLEVGHRKGPVHIEPLGVTWEF